VQPSTLHKPFTNVVSASAAAASPFAQLFKQLLHSLDLALHCCLAAVCCFVFVNSLKHVAAADKKSNST
jgi:hypothetical protein